MTVVPDALRRRRNVIATPGVRTACDPKALAASVMGTLGDLTLESLLTPPVCGVLALIAANRTWRIVRKRRRRLTAAPQPAS